MTTALAQHWQLMLAAAAIGLLLGVALVAVSYLAPLVRLCLATSVSDQACILKGEIERLRQVGDAAAVLEEHDHSEARGLRAEAEVRALLLLLAPCHAWAWGRSREDR